MTRIILTFLIAVAGLAVQAQSDLASADAYFASETELVPDETGMNWTFFHNKEDQIYYVDFERFRQPFGMLVVRDQSNNEVIYSEDLGGLPANMMYELDLKRFPLGFYTLELHSHAEVVKQDFILD